MTLEGDDLCRPLRDTEFVVVDLETSGTSATASVITEVGAVKVRAGEELGVFATLVAGHDGHPQAGLPPLAAVLPAFLEFVGPEAVIVGHNVRFDLSFLGAGLGAHGYGPLRHPVVDTCALARRLLAGEVPDHRLGTLALRLHLEHQPTHRALDDVRATVDLLHLLLERAGTIGVTALDDLLALPTTGRHPHIHKVRLATALPRRPGVYLCRDHVGRALHLAWAGDLHRHALRLFTAPTGVEQRRLVSRTSSIEHTATATDLDAAIAAVALRRRLLPATVAYVSLTGGRSPRIQVTPAPPADGGPFLGPVPSAAAARLLAGAMRASVPLGPRLTAAERLRSLSCLARGLAGEPDLLLGPLDQRMHALLGTGRFDEAAAVGDRAGALGLALHRQQRLDALCRAAPLVLEVDGRPTTVAFADGPTGAEEASAVLDWLDASTGRWRLVDTAGAGAPASPLPTLPPPRSLAR